MKTRRLGMALLMALAVSLTSTYFLYTRIKHQSIKTSAIKIVVSSKALDAGTQLAPDQLMLVDWPSNLPIEGTMMKPEDAVGRILLYPVPLKEPIRQQLLAGPGAAIGLTAKIPNGMRAVAVVTNEVNNVSGFLFPGSHVDVLATFRGEAGKEPMTTTVLQNIEVLSTGERLEPDPSGKPQNVKVVTLLITPDDAQKLSLASSQGTLQFVLRNGSDQQPTEQRPTLISELQGAGSAAVAAPKTPRTTTPPKPVGYEVEIFDGTKKSVTKF
jgi:pilus assembly protein CpaB